MAAPGIGNPPVQVIVSGDPLGDDSACLSFAFKPRAFWIANPAAVLSKMHHNLVVGASPTNREASAFRNSSEYSEE